MVVDGSEKAEAVLNKTLDPTQVSSLVDANQDEQNAQSKISKTETNQNKVSEQADELEKAYFKSMTQEDEDQP